MAQLQAILGDGPREGAARDAALWSLFEDVRADSARRWEMDVTLEGLDALEGVDACRGWELLCIAEEALNNAGKHGRAAHASIHIERTGGGIVLEVTDDGVGILEPLGEDGLPPGARGLWGMQERVRGLAGTLKIEAAAGGGTTVRVETRSR